MIEVRCERCDARLFDTGIVKGYIEIVCRNCGYLEKLYFMVNEEDCVGELEARIIMTNKG